MVHSFANLLISLNYTSGNRSWWAAYVVGWMMIVLWLVGALPWVDIFTGSMVGIGRFTGPTFDLTMVVYGQEISGPIIDHYFIVSFLGIVLVKLGLLITEVSSNFATGYMYAWRPELGIFGGKWSR